jgi:hypothetical protein
MLYRKNVGTVERVVRIVAGCSLMLCGYMVFGQSAMAWLTGASGLLTIATGIVGCPTCARLSVDELLAAKLTPPPGVGPVSLADMERAIEEGAGGRGDL